MSSQSYSLQGRFPVVSQRRSATTHRERELTAEPKTEPTTEELLDAVSQHNQEAFVLLFRRYSQLVFAVGMKVLHKAEDADELVQEVFIFLWQRSHLYSASAAASKKDYAHNWLVRVIYHRAFDRRRQLNARSRHIDNQREYDTYKDSVIDEHFESTNLDDLVHLRLLLRSAFEDLSVKQRETLRLYFYEGFSLEEIGEQLRENYGSTKNHFYRGLKRLKRHFIKQDMLA